MSAGSTATTWVGFRRCGASGTGASATPYATGGAATTGCLADFASRLCASADIYGDPAAGRRPSASVNFITVHDGFTLTDLVSYNGKHNEANARGQP